MMCYGTIRITDHAQAQALWMHWDPDTPLAYIRQQQALHVSIISVASFTGRICSGTCSSIGLVAVVNVLAAGWISSQPRHIIALSHRSSTSSLPCRLATSSAAVGMGIQCETRFLGCCYY
jgi:hypothetical protein